MPSISQPQHIRPRPDHRPEGSVSLSAALPVRPPTPAFMARRRHDVLSQTIAQEIVPRLILARGANAAITPPERTVADAAAQAGDVTSLTDILLHQDLGEAVAFVGGVFDHGTAVEDVYLNLLTPVARNLGAMWEEDLCDFVQVTTSLSRLHHVLNGLSAPFQDDPLRMARRHRVMLVPGPGDNHSFGLSMVASFFQRAGWSGWTGVPESPADLIRRVHAESFAVIGFSVGCGRRLEALSSAIRSVRRASMNPDIRIMVGGPVFALHPELVAMVGADATAVDGRQAVLQAQSLLALIPIRA